MKVKDMMTPDPACCTADTSLPEVARMMVDKDCGEIAVVENKSSKIPVGVVTDRDIVCRTVANGLNQLQLVARRKVKARQAKGAGLHAFLIRTGQHHTDHNQFDREKRIRSHS